MDVTVDMIRAGEAGSITLQKVAKVAEVSVQTILRAFSSKEGLLTASLNAQPSEAAEDFLADTTGSENVPVMMSVLYDFYDKIGDTVMKRLADEAHLPELAAANAVGREFHRKFVNQRFAHELDNLREEERHVLFNALMAVTDLYVWRVLRRDEGLDPDAAKRVVTLLVSRTIGKG